MDDEEVRIRCLEMAVEMHTTAMRNKLRCVLESGRPATVEDTAESYYRFATAGPEIEEAGDAPRQAVH